MSQPAPVTALLRAWSGGDEEALGVLLPLVEAELRRLARAYMARERIGHTLQTTALVNEAFLRLIDAKQVPWQDRAHFLGISARLMRRVLVDHARTRDARKRGDGDYKVALDEDMAVSKPLDVNLVDLDRALNAFALVDEREVPRDRDALLCGNDGRGNGGSAARVHRHRQTRLAAGEALVAEGARPLTFRAFAAGQPPLADRM